MDKNANVSPGNEGGSKSSVQQEKKPKSSFKSDRDATSLSASSRECGCGQFQPTWLQYFHNAKCFLVCLCFCSITQGMVVNGLIPISITTLEKRFQLTSTQTGFLASFYDIAVVLALAPVSHFGGRGHKPRWMGYGVIIMGIGSLVFALPQFIVGRYSPVSVRDVCVNSSTTFNCTSTNTSDQTSKIHLLFYLFLFGQLLHGLGASPLYTLGVTFLDESVTQAASPVYLGLLYGFSIFGPVIGFLMGGALLTLDGDLDKRTTFEKMIATTPDDPLWYGAWWLGFILAGILGIAFGVPLLSFAPRLPNAEENRAKDVDQQHNVNVGEAKVGKQLKDFPKAVLQLLKNLPFLFIVCMKCAEAFLMNGFVTFVPKMLENFFSLSSSYSSMLSGAVLIPGGLFGTVLGGYLVRRLQMKCRGMIVLALVCEFLSMFFVLGLMIYCAESRFVGVNVHAFGSTVESGVINECNKYCSCSSNYNPVCHKNSSLVYYSPCSAGCTSNFTTFVDDAGGTLKRWTNCTCVGDFSLNETHDEVVDQGYCPLSCGRVTIFLIICGTHIFLTFVASTPVQQIELRCVSFEQRTLAVSFSWVFVRLLGTIPGVILIGYAIDKVCSLWKMDCGKKVSCLRYSNANFSTSVVAIGVGLKLAICLFLVLTLCVYRPKSAAKSEEAKTVCKMHNSD